VGDKFALEPEKNSFEYLNKALGIKERAINLEINQGLVQDKAAHLE